MKGVMDRHSFVPHVRGAVVQDSDASDGKLEKAMAVDYFVRNMSLSFVGVAFEGLLWCKTVTCLMQKEEKAMGMDCMV